MRGLVILVSVMTLLIVIALGFVVYGITHTANTPQPNGGAIPLTLPKGSIIRQIAGVKDYLAVQIRHNKSDMIYFIDPKSGKILSKMPVEYKD